MTTNRVINDPDRVVEDMLQGWIAAHGDTLRIDAGSPASCACMARHAGARWAS